MRAASGPPSSNAAPPAPPAPPERSAPSTAPSARKIHRARLADQHDLDLSGILQLGLDTPGDLLGHRRHAHVVDVVGQYNHAHFAARLNGEHLLDALVARRDPLEALEPLHVRFERLTARAGTRARHGI